MTSKKSHHGLLSTELHDHEEKPSQRIRSLYIILLLAFYLLLLYITNVIEEDLPRVIREKDIAKDDSNTFSEESARKYLHRILGDQPRVSGTVYHFVKTRDLKYLVDEIESKANLPVSTDWQYSFGDFWLSFKSPYVNCYQNLSNIIAVLEGESGFKSDGTIGSSLLVNCHYDSVPFAIGASDNGVFCAAMAEILSKLSRRKQKLKHNIIFLFNGAEENGLMASHGFLSHPWAKGVKNIVNLDSAGMNGKPNIFQVTDPRVLNAYKATSSRPNAQGLAEVLFASGIIPSDTDFRIFRDFGHMYGIDIAFIKDGFVYHTRNDRPELITAGVIQNAGDMLLQLVRELADSEELGTEQSPVTPVYFDYLGLFLVTYSKSTALVVDLSVGILGLLSVVYYLWMFGLRWSSVRDLLWSAVGRVLCVLGGLLAAALLTSFAVLCAPQMRYLSAEWMVIPLYAVPYVTVMVFVSQGFDSWRARKTSLSRSIRACQALAATRLLVSLLLLAACCLPALSNVRYVLTLLLLLAAASSLVTISFVRYGRLKAWQHLVLVLLLSAPAALFPLSLALRLLQMLIPITGRAAADTPDYTIAAVTVLLATLAILPSSGVELLFSRRRLWLPLGAVLLVCVGFMLAPFSPYGGVVTQRHYWFHTQITTYDANFTPIETKSGVLITKPDRNSVSSALQAIKDSPFYVRDSQTERNASQNNTDSEVTLKITDSDLKIIDLQQCEKELYCGMPVYRTRFEKYYLDSLFVTMEPPMSFEHSLKLVNKTCSQDACVMSFEMRGPECNTITIWPRAGVSLQAWSFASPVRETFTRAGRPVYVVTQTYGTYTEVFEPLEFSLNVTGTPHAGALLQASHSAHRMHAPAHFTRGYRRLAQLAPAHFNIATFLSFRDDYVF